MSASPHSARPALAQLLARPTRYFSESRRCEPPTLRALLVPVALLALVPAIGGLVGGLIAASGELGYGGYGRLIGAQLIEAFLIKYLFSLVSWIALARIIEALTRTLDAERSPALRARARELGLAAVAPLWLAEVLDAATLPLLSWIAALAGLGAGGYLLHVGLTTLVDVPRDKAPGLAVVAMLCLALLWVVLGLLRCIA